MNNEARYDEATVDLVASKLPFVNFDDDDFDEVDLIRHVLDALADAGLLYPAAAQFAPCTTAARSRRHWVSPDYHAVCTMCGHAAYEQDGLDDLDDKAGAPRTARIVDLPPCKQCDRSRQRRIDGRPR